LRQNLVPVVSLAVPGLLMSTVITGVVVWLATGIELPYALLLGSILSATDPVAVVALFKRLGAPARLTVLVEGESLLNDATAIVLSRILLGVIAAGAISGATVVDGIIDFIVVFAGGYIVGWVMAMAVAWLLGRIHSDANVEITLTTILAYLSFIVAEEAFHLSGVMAVVAAGLTVGGLGQAKISPEVKKYFEHFWEYMGFVATAIIFLLVGLRTNIGGLIDVADILVWVIIGMLVSRALSVFGLMPVVNNLLGAELVAPKYRMVMYWGGLRGAIALAIVLSLPDFELKTVFIDIVIGAVLFTLIVQGLSIQTLVRKLGLDKPPLSDRFARLEGELSARRKALARIPELLQGGLFRNATAKAVNESISKETAELEGALHALRTAEIDENQEKHLLALRGLAEEKAVYLDLFAKGHLTEKAFRHLTQLLVLQADAMRFKGSYAGVHRKGTLGTRAADRALAILAKIPGLASVVESARLGRLALDYEVAWGHFQSSAHVLENLQDLASKDELGAGVEELSSRYSNWHEVARQQLDDAAAQYPEFVNAVQERLAKRMILLAQDEAYVEQVRRGLIPRGMGEALAASVREQARRLSGGEVARLRIEPRELIRKVPFLASIGSAEVEEIVNRLQPFTATSRQRIFAAGDQGDALYLIARGVVRISVGDKKEGTERDVATLMAGDFFGEMALLDEAPRAANVTAMTPCTMYKLKRSDVLKLMVKFPGIRATLEEEGARRRTELDAI
ncbi:MAG: cyclic nucleotide-binding domain-containing protein, partial [Gammaproteobacteria bacterium]|nr:cyclic nucleotide-binding domain-containing protein [Gammaproteobacteria bacterium]